MGIELRRESEAKWDMTLADLQVIDACRRRAMEFFLLLRNDLDTALPYLDCLYGWYMAILPYCTKEESAEHDALFDKAYANIEDEMARLALNKKMHNNPSLRVKTNQNLFLECRELMRRLYLLKQAKNLGIGQVNTFKQGSGGSLSSKVN